MKLSVIIWGPILDTTALGFIHRPSFFSLTFDVLTNNFISKFWFNHLKILTLYLINLTFCWPYNFVLLSQKFNIWSVFFNPSTFYLRIVTFYSLSFAFYLKNVGIFVKILNELKILKFWFFFFLINWNFNLEIWLFVTLCLNFLTLSS